MDQSRMEALVRRLGPAAVANMFSPDEWQVLLYDWRQWAREKQKAPEGDWETWLLLAGRGFGKTKTGAEFVREKIESGQWRRVALVARTAADVRKVMVEGPSGLLTIAPSWCRPKYEPSQRKLTWPNGATATTYTAEKPDMLRGPEHDGAWCDELAAWKYLDEAWDNLQFGLRIGRNPQVVATTTPRGLKFLRELIKEQSCVTTRGSMYENRRNLPKSFLGRITRKYAGTRLGRQEIEAEILDDNPNAQWQSKQIEALRFNPARFAALVGDMIRVVVGVDPAVTDNPDSDETGIVVCGKAWCRCKGTPQIHGFVIDDRSGLYTPGGWAKAVIQAYGFNKGDRVIAEVNNGGDLVESNVRTAEGGSAIPFKKIHASRGKQMRHEPVAGLYEQGNVHHVGMFAELEDQMTQWDPTQTKSPDRLDAATIALTELLVEPEHETAEIGIEVYS